MPARMPPDRDAVDRFEALFARTYSDVAAFCARRAASREDAEEATTESYAIAWRRRADVPPEPEDRLWLFGVARRVLANEARARRRRDRLAARLRAEAAGAARLGAPPVVAERSSPTARALHALPDSDRELLLLVAWEELSVAEVATVLGVPAPVVSRRLHRARRRFAHVLNAAGSAVGDPPASGQVLPEPTA